MECPFCHQIMEKGFIHGDRYAIRWIEESKDKGFFRRMFQKGIQLTDPWASNKLETYYCKNCEKMIFDVMKEVE